MVYINFLKSFERRNITKFGDERDDVNLTTKIKYENKIKRHSRSSRMYIYTRANYKYSKLSDLGNSGTNRVPINRN